MVAEGFEMAALLDRSFSIEQRQAIASLYADVLQAVGRPRSSRIVRIAVLETLVRDASRGRLDPFVSRERALAAVHRLQDHALMAA